VSSGPARWPLNRSCSHKKTSRAVSFAENTPVNGRHEANFSFDHIDADQPFYANLKYGDLDYARAFGLRMAAGHWYTTNDTLGEAVINETMAHRLGVRDVEKAVGRQIRIGMVPGGPSSAW